MTVGEYLRKLREEKAISLEKVSEGTNIRIKYLQAIEDDQLDRLPSLSQAKGFTRLYADYLGLSSRDVFDEVEKLNQPEKVVPETKEAATDVPAPVLVEKAQPLKRDRKKRRIGAAEPGKSQEKKTAASDIEIPVSQVIFNEIGKELKRQRESLGLSLADVERLTKIREFFVYALENGQIDELPSTVQGRGMLNNYASYLNLNAESLQLRYAEGLQKRRQEKFQIEEETRKGGVTVMGKEPLSGWRRFLTPDLLVGGTVFIILFALVIWGATQMIRTTNPEPVSTLSSISEILVGDGTQDTTLTEAAPGSVSPAITGTPSALNTAQVDLEATLSSVGAGPIQVVVVARQRAYMKITVDGEEAFAGRVVPGNVYSYTGSTKITLLTGNAAALQVYYNQQDQGVLGPMGNVVELEFTRQEMVTPTPRFSPTPTLTQRPTLTELPTNTPPPTPTVLTATITPARAPVP